MESAERKIRRFGLNLSLRTPNPTSFHWFRRRSVLLMSSQLQNNALVIRDRLQRKISWVFWRSPGEKSGCASRRPRWLISHLCELLKGCYLGLICCPFMPALLARLLLRIDHCSVVVKTIASETELSASFAKMPLVCSYILNSYLCTGHSTVRHVLLCCR